MRKRLFFLDHDHQEGGQEDGKSRSNDFEAKFCVRLSNYLMQQGCFENGENSHSLEIAIRFLYAHR